MRARGDQIEGLASRIQRGCPDLELSRTLAKNYVEEIEQRVRAEIARDSERLDWLERIAPDISMVGDGWGNRDHWHLVFADISKGVPAECTGDTIRQAIDAAREVG